MTLRAKLSLMFFAALQVTFLTAIGTFWAVQSWQLLTDDLTLIHEQNERLERAVQSGTERPAVAPSEHLRALRLHAQRLQEVELIEALAQALGLPLEQSGSAAREVQGTPSEIVERLKEYYRGQVSALGEQARRVTRLSTGLFVAIVLLVLAGMMAYFAAIRLWLVRPLQALGRATGIISTGDLAHRVPITGRDEFGALAESINTMAASLVENQRRLVAAERFAMVGEMSAYVAHNIRNPLASIRTTAQAELLDLAPDDPRRASFADIVTATDRLEGWVGDLLRFSSPVTLMRVPESLNALIERCAELVRPELRRKGLTLDLVLAPDLTPISLDPNKMEQVVTTLLANAADASPAGAAIRVISGAGPGANGTASLSLRVEDTGNGIPRERLGKLFTLFSTTKKSGTGLGLALAQKIVTAHDGTITIASEEGRGTRVEIVLPAGERSSERVDHPHR